MLCVTLKMGKGKKNWQSFHYAPKGFCVCGHGSIHGELALHISNGKHYASFISHREAPYLNILYKYHQILALHSQTGQILHFFNMNTVSPLPS